MPSAIVLRTSGGASPRSGGSTAGVASGTDSFAAEASTRSMAASYSRSTPSASMCSTGTLSMRYIR